MTTPSPEGRGEFIRPSGEAEASSTHTSTPPAEGGGEFIHPSGEAEASPTHTSTPASEGGSEFLRPTGEAEASPTHMTTPPPEGRSEFLRPSGETEASPAHRFAHLKETSIPPSKGDLKKIAVIGMACRFPQSNSLESFWDNLQQGRDLISEVPTERWGASDYYSPQKDAPNMSYSKWGGFIDGVDLFDAKFFGVSEVDALVMDPQHRLLLELTQELLDRSGYGKDEIGHTRTGVFIGGAESSYVKKNVDKVPADHTKHMLINTIQNMMSARISDHYNLTGPSHVLDTACSSSLVSIHQACQNIRYGECDMAIAGGVILLLDPFPHISFSKAEVLSDEGTCYVFDERAKGIVISEGAGLVLLKSYEQAVEDGDNILAVILGSAVNNDGHTVGLTVPNLEGQKAVIHQALRNSDVDPSSISYLEAHGTGTSLGDPIEIKAATQVYREYTQDRQFCAVGSVKSNMGHLLLAAGVASLIKVILALQKKTIPPTIHCERPHPRFRFEESPFYPVTETKDWAPREGVRRVAISSFGFGGTNCHLIMEEAPGLPAGASLREPRPLTQFHRKRYWLGKEIEDVAPEEKRSDGEDYLKLIRDLKDGKLSVDQASELISGSGVGSNGAGGGL